MRFHIFSLVTIFLSVLCAYPQATGGISGVVRDDSAQSVNGAYAVASPVGQPYGRQSYTTVTSAGGEFSFSGMIPGAYTICIQRPGGQHLDPCHWSTPMQVTVTAGQTSANQTVAVTRARTIRIRIQDPQKFLANSAPTDLLVGIFAPSKAFQPLRLTATDSNGRDYEALVPFDTEIKVSVNSTHLLISDQNGNALGRSAAAGASTSATVTVPASKSQGVTPVTLTVTGKQ